MLGLRGRARVTSRARASVFEHGRTGRGQHDARRVRCFEVKGSEAMEKVELCGTCTERVVEGLRRNAERARRLDVALCAVGGVLLIGASLWMMLKPPADE